jgi:mannose-6-phosphate isomerase-like protein (cupin superfamily)
VQAASATIAIAAQVAGQPCRRTPRPQGCITGLYATAPTMVPGRIGALESGPTQVLVCRALDAFELADLVREQAASGRLYHEFIRTHDLSVGIYVLPAGGTDPQGPHTEDEVYYVVSGRGRIRVGTEDRAVQAGSTVFVGADVEHRFHDIEEQLVLVVAFGPAEYTHRVDHQSGRPHGAAAG